MAAHQRVFRSLPLALVLTSLAVVAGCSADRVAALTTTAIVRLPTGFHAARPNDDATSTRAAVRAGSAVTELATLRLEGAHRRAAAAIAADPGASATGGFVCQIDMGTAPLD